MREHYRRTRGWMIAVGAGLLLLAGGFVLRSSVEGRSSTNGVRQSDFAEESGSRSELELYHERSEPVGWVFGRMVGFEGADKPLLPRQASPAPMFTPPPSLSPR